MVHKKTGGEDVAAGEVGLKLSEIADAEDVVVIGADGEFGVDGVVVFAVEGVVEPDFSLLDGAGESKARKELVETPSVLVLDGRDEVGGEEAEVIIADAGVETEQAAGSFAGFGGLARGLDLNGAKGVGADADEKLSVGGLGDVEAVEQGDGLVGLGAGDVGLAGLILHDAGNEIEGVAVVVGGGIDDVDDVEAADGFLRGDLSGIDGGRRFVDVDDFADFLLVRDGDFDRGAWRELDAGLDERVEAFFFDAELILAGGERGERAASGEIGLAADGGLRRGLERDAGGGTATPFSSVTMMMGADWAAAVPRRASVRRRARMRSGIFYGGCGSGGRVLDLACWVQNPAVSRVTEQWVPADSRIKIGRAVRGGVAAELCSAWTGEGARPPTQPYKLLGFGGQVLADALDGVALAVVEGEEFESVAQALAVADDGADFDGIGREGQRNFESDDLSGFETAG